MESIAKQVNNLEYQVEKYRRLAEINESIIEMMFLWLQVDDEYRLPEVLKALSYRKVAIYGYSRLGRIFAQKLQKTDIEIVCVIDRKSYLEETAYLFIRPDEKIPETDVIIVTNIYIFDEIRDGLERHTATPIVSLADILCML